MIAKLEWTQSNPQQNIEQFILQNPIMGVTIYNASTTAERFQFHNEIWLPWPPKVKLYN